jgi:arylsulfatase A-like enzyme
MLVLPALLSSGCAGGTPRGVASAATTSLRRPNVLFLITDDQRWDALSCVQKEQGSKARFPWLKTPNMDRLAAEGARFRNAFVVHSLCSPSRASFLTGKYSHETGVRNNATPIPPQPNWATELSKAGYVTAYFGKWHCDMQKDRPGFQHVVTYVGQGRYENCPLLIDGKPSVAKGWIDDVITDYAIEFLKSHHADSSGKPFAMVVGFKSPHDPRHPAARHANDYAGDAMGIPISADNLPPFFSVYSGGKPHKPFDPHNKDYINYFRCISCVDDDLGRILAALDQLGLSDDTMVIFVGDNGYYLGEHGLNDKRSGYEESLRIPLLARYPRLIKPGTLIDADALNIDLAPTIMDLAGIKIPQEVQGRSWRPLFDGSTPKDWRTSFLYENFQDPPYPKVTFDVLGVRTDDAKLMTYPGHPDWTQLFDLKADPYEMHNLINDPKAADLRKWTQAALVKQERKESYPQRPD